MYHYDKKGMPSASLFYLCHYTTFFGAMPAFFGTSSAMLHVGMFFTFIRTSVANICTFSQQMFAVYRTPGK
jgi:hypothetical protein